jgi:integrase
MPVNGGARLVQPPTHIGCCGVPRPAPEWQDRSTNPPLFGTSQYSGTSGRRKPHGARPRRCPRSSRQGESREPRNALRALKDAARQAGLPKIGLHTLRHSAAAVMLVNGVPLKVVSEVLGHASIGITGDIYGHVAPDVSRDALARLSVALG